MSAGASAHLWDHCGKGDDSIRIIVGNAALMPGDNRLGGGQANSVTSSGAGAGGICPVKTVKVTGELGGVHSRTWV